MAPPAFIHLTYKPSGGEAKKKVGVAVCGVCACVCFVELFSGCGCSNLGRVRPGSFHPSILCWCWFAAVDLL